VTCKKGKEIEEWIITTRFDYEVHCQIEYESLGEVVYKFGIAPKETFGKDQYIYMDISGEAVEKDQEITANGSFYVGVVSFK
jgi:hypothetical protein